MTNTQPVIIWTGPIDGTEFRVVDVGAPAAERLIVEMQGLPDAMGVRPWLRVEPIPRRVFERLLIQSGVVT